MLKDHKALELDKILLQLANETTCPDAAELAQKIEPDTDIRHVERLLQETDDAFVLMAKYGAPSFYGMTNVTNALRRAEAGGVLNLAELLSVAATLRAIRSVSDWRKKSESVKTSSARKKLPIPQASPWRLSAARSARHRCACASSLIK